MAQRETPGPSTCANESGSGADPGLPRENGEARLPSLGAAQQRQSPARTMSDISSDWSLRATAAESLTPPWGSPCFPCPSPPAAAIPCAVIVLIPPVARNPFLASLAAAAGRVRSTLWRPSRCAIVTGQLASSGRLAGREPGRPGPQTRAKETALFWRGCASCAHKPAHCPQRHPVTL